MAASDAASPISDGGSDFRPPSDVDDNDSDEYVDDGVAEVDDDPGDDGDYDDDGDFGMAPKARGRGRGARGRGGRGAANLVRGAKGGRAARKSTGVAFTTGTSRRTSEAFGPSTIAAASESDLMAYPPAYREYLLSSSVVMVKGPDWKKDYYPNTGGTRVPVFPLGPLVPFASSLTTQPNEPGHEGHTCEVAVLVDTDTGDERVQKRRVASRNLAKRFGLLEPWQAWEGEGWWPEMAAGGSGPMEGWSWRTDVRLGLEDVGRGWKKNVLPPA